MEKNSTHPLAPKTREERRILKYVNRRLRGALEGLHKRLRQAYYETHKDPQGYVRCPVTGKRIAFHELSVDHYPTPYCVLRDQWLRERNIPLSLDMKISTEQVQDWQRWHEQHAQLRLLDRATKKQLGCHIM